MAFLNQLCGDLSAADTTTLLELLARLRQSLLSQAAPDFATNGPGAAPERKEE